MGDAKSLMNAVDEQMKAEQAEKTQTGNDGMGSQTNTKSGLGTRDSQRGNRNKKPESKKFQRVLSSRAINIGQELGITAEFVTQ